jgi:putative flippase GtrA
MTARSTPGQLWRYAAVGIASNLILYVAYLVLTHWGMPSKLAMTLLYVVGVAQTFFLHKHWSFRSTGSSGPQLRRYFLAYAAGYGFNLMALFVLVDGLGWAHQVAQGILVLATAVLLFLLQKFWVFRTPRPPAQSR